MARTRLAEAEIIDIPLPQPYFVSEKTHLDLFSTGCTLLDCVIGGGWCLGRISNIIGGEATGKTLLAIEAASNFLKKFPNGKIFYREAEAAFDEDYAAALGMPVQEVDFNDEIFTVEDFERDLSKVIDKLDGAPALYIMDSLDALSDEGELKRDIGEATYGANKARQSSALFRRVVKKVGTSRMALLIVSQIRDNIGVTFGQKWQVSGGRALRFYATHRVFLKHVGIINKTIKGIARPIGINVEATCVKNKIGLPLRKCKFDILYGYGIDDTMASLDWLDEIKRGDVLPGGNVKSFGKELAATTGSDRLEMIFDLNQIVIQTWREIEEGFLPTTKKY